MGYPRIYDIRLYALLFMRVIRNYFGNISNDFSQDYIVKNWSCLACIKKKELQARTGEWFQSASTSNFSPLRDPAAVDNMIDPDKQYEHQNTGENVNQKPTLLSTSVSSLSKAFVTLKQNANSVKQALSNANANNNDENQTSQLQQSQSLNSSTVSLRTNSTSSRREHTGSLLLTPHDKMDGEGIPVSRSSSFSAMPKRKSSGPRPPRPPPPRSNSTSSSRSPTRSPLSQSPTPDKQEQSIPNGEMNGHDVELAKSSQEEPKLATRNDHHVEDGVTPDDSKTKKLTPSRPPLPSRASLKRRSSRSQSTSQPSDSATPSNDDNRIIPAHDNNVNATPPTDFSDNPRQPEKEPTEDSSDSLPNGEEHQPTSPKASTVQPPKVENDSNTTTAEKPTKTREAAPSNMTSVNQDTPQNNDQETAEVKAKPSESKKVPPSRPPRPHPNALKRTLSNKMKTQQQPRKDSKTDQEVPKTMHVSDDIPQAQQPTSVQLHPVPKEVPKAAKEEPITAEENDATLNEMPAQTNEHSATSKDSPTRGHSVNDLPEDAAIHDSHDNHAEISPKDQDKSITPHGDAITQKQEHQNHAEVIPEDSGKVGDLHLKADRQPVSKPVVMPEVQKEAPQTVIKVNNDEHIKEANHTGSNNIAPPDTTSTHSRSSSVGNFSDDDVFEDALSDGETEEHTKAAAVGTSESAAPTDGIKEPINTPVTVNEAKKTSLESPVQKRIRIPSVEDTVDAALASGIATAAVLSSPKNLQNANTKNQAFKLPPDHPQDGIKSSEPATVSKPQQADVKPKIENEGPTSDNKQTNLKHNQSGSKQHQDSKIPNSVSSSNKMKNTITNRNEQPQVTVQTKSALPVKIIENQTPASQLKQPQQLTKVEKEPSPAMASNHLQNNTNNGHNGAMNETKSVPTSKSKSKSPKSTPSKTKSAIAAGIVLADTTAKNKSPRSTPSKTKAAAVANAMNADSKTGKGSTKVKNKSANSTPSKTKAAATAAAVNSSNSTPVDNSSSNKKSSVGSRSKAAEIKSSKPQTSTRRPLSALFGGKSKDDKPSKSPEVTKKSAGQNIQPSNSTSKDMNRIQNNVKPTVSDSVATDGTLQASQIQSQAKLEKAETQSKTTESQTSKENPPNAKPSLHQQSVSTPSSHEVGPIPNNQEPKVNDDHHEEGEPPNIVINRRSSKIETKILKPSELDTAIQRKSQLDSNDNPNTLNDINKLPATKQDDTKPMTSSNQQENNITSPESKPTNNNSSKFDNNPVATEEPLTNNYHTNNKSQIDLSPVSKSKEVEENTKVTPQNYANDTLKAEPTSNRNVSLTSDATTVNHNSQITNVSSKESINVSPKQHLQDEPKTITNSSQEIEITPVPKTKGAVNAFLRSGMDENDSKSDNHSHEPPTDPIVEEEEIKPTVHRVTASMPLHFLLEPEEDTELDHDGKSSEPSVTETAQSNPKIQVPTDMKVNHIPSADEEAKERVTVHPINEHDSNKVVKDLKHGSQATPYTKSNSPKVAIKSKQEEVDNKPHTNLHDTPSYTKAYPQKEEESIHHDERNNVNAATEPKVNTTETANLSPKMNKIEESKTIHTTDQSDHKTANLSPKMSANESKNISQPDHSDHDHETSGVKAPMTSTAAVNSSITTTSHDVPAAASIEKTSAHDEIANARTSEVAPPSSTAEKAPVKAETAAAVAGTTEAVATTSATISTASTIPANTAHEITPAASTSIKTVRNATVEDATVVKLNSNTTNESMSATPHVEAGNDAKKEPNHVVAQDDHDHAKVVAAAVGATAAAAATAAAVSVTADATAHPSPEINTKEATKAAANLHADMHHEDVKSVAAAVIASNRARKRLQNRIASQTSIQTVDKVTGRMKIKLWHEKVTENLVITVFGAEDLYPCDHKVYRNAYAKVFMYPEASQFGKRRTKTCDRQLNPTWNQTFMYFSISDKRLESSSLQVTIWDNDKDHGIKFLGEVIIKMATARLDNQPHWYLLRNHDHSVGQLPPPTPIKKTASDKQSSHGLRRSNVSLHATNTNDDSVGAISEDSVVGHPEEVYHSSVNANKYRVADSSNYAEHAMSNTGHEDAPSQSQDHPSEADDNTKNQNHAATSDASNDDKKTPPRKPPRIDRPPSEIENPAVQENQTPLKTNHNDAHQTNHVSTTPTSKLSVNIYSTKSMY
ncbi:uncharacterized protein TRIADDRAFT_58202 [Trichoplax adhaerens]|uniref:C2 domain-containing protein n=1 Tax=Trichoplax adhaerens TaxID=10228 RepID=B3S155_TRIAD|nr:hypothetical protein TRIADDRAFT_58202 [Trichoplax adhaerens]EDV23179.1 hypothetical protein TRIADDRAFT_58202 [Trichoplax adhaerens]|eukprot:XP_002114089.1 hypothetical protein TRIADDRAFT_58202 [Trichoplax adhaerens]